MPENCICIKFPNLLIFFYLKISSLELVCQQHESSIQEKNTELQRVKEELDKHTQIAALIHNLSSGKAPPPGKIFMSDNIQSWYLFYSLSHSCTVSILCFLCSFLFFFKNILKIIKNKEWFTKHFFNIYWHFAFKEGKSNVNSIEKAFIATNSNISKMSFKTKYIF